MLFGKIFASLRHGKSIRMTPPEGGYPASDYILKAVKNGLFQWVPLTFRSKTTRLYIDKKIYSKTLKYVLLFFIIFISFFR